MLHNIAHLKMKAPSLGSKFVLCFSNPERKKANHSKSWQIIARFTFQELILQICRLMA